MSDLLTLAKDCVLQDAHSKRCENPEAHGYSGVDMCLNAKVDEEEDGGEEESLYYHESKEAKQVAELEIAVDYDVLVLPAVFVGFEVDQAHENDANHASNTKSEGVVGLEGPMLLSRIRHLRLY